MKIAHIPCGIRCTTKNKISALGVKQATLPFDWGFFSPQSILFFLEKEKIDINIHNTSPCLKFEDSIVNSQKGVLFKQSSYNAINNFILKNGFERDCKTPFGKLCNRYLDTTRGYYTWVKDYNFVLAHYNSQLGDPIKNLQKIQETFSKRKQRLIELIHGSDKIHLYFHNPRNYDFIQIDDIRHEVKNSKNKLIEAFERFNKEIKFIDFN